MKNNNNGHSEILSWPMTQSQLDNLGTTRRVSPRVGNDHGYSPVSEAQYKEEVEELLPLRELVEKGIWPKDFLVKHLGSSELSQVLLQTLGSSLRDPRKAADTVRMDHPFDIWDIIIEPWAKSQGIKYRIPLTHEGVPFVEGVMYRAQAHSIIANALNKCFDVKDAFGTCRPDEYYDCSVTRYPTPNHGEEPAGHGGFAGAGARAFDIIYKPNQDQLDKVIEGTKQFAMFRSFSGMHKASSNLLGWKIGYESI